MARQTRAMQTAMAEREAADVPTHDAIAARAFELYESRGGADGRDVEDWLDAERELLESALRRGTEEL
jgi:hypothetical protein